MSKLCIEYFIKVFVYVTHAYVHFKKDAYAKARMKHLMDSFDIRRVSAAKESS